MSGAGDEDEGNDRACGAGACPTAVADPVQTVEKEVALALPQGRVFVRFNVDQFMKTLIYHCFFPLSLPLVVWWDGYGMARNMLMTFSGFNVSHIINWSAQFTMLFANVVAAVAGLEPTLGGIFGLELVSARRRFVRC